MIVIQIRSAFIGFISYGFFWMNPLISAFRVPCNRSVNEIDGVPIRFKLPGQTEKMIFFINKL